jgi:acetylornithine deacetylase
MGPRAADDEIVATLHQLVAVPSVGGTEAEVGIQHHLADRLSDLGLEVDLWRIDMEVTRAHPDYPGDEAVRSEAYGLVATNRPGEVVETILQGHVDVVPMGDPRPWRSAPFAPVLRDGSLVGRGACDMKGGIAAILGAVAATRGQHDDLPAFAVHLVIGEEDGGLGAFATLQRGHTGRSCVIPEPTSLRAVTANAGALTFRIEVPGQATHGSTRYFGSSALDSYIGIHLALAGLERRRNRTPEDLVADLQIPYPLSVGRVRTGDWPSSVPDLLVAEGRYGLRIDEDPAVARTELESAVGEAADHDAYLRDHPPRVTWLGGQYRGGQLPAGHRLLDRMAASHTFVTGAPIGPERGAPWGSDLRLYAGAGIPTLHYGPGDVCLAHGPNESVPISEVLTAAKALAHLLN